MPSKNLIAAAENICRHANSSLFYYIWDTKESHALEVLVSFRHGNEVHRLVIVPGGNTLLHVQSLFCRVVHLVENEDLKYTKAK